MKKLALVLFVLVLFALVPASDVLAQGWGCAGAGCPGGSGYYGQDPDVLLLMQGGYYDIYGRIHPPARFNGYRNGYGRGGRRGSIGGDIVGLAVGVGAIGYLQRMETRQLHDSCVMGDDNACRLLYTRSKKEFAKAMEARRVPIVPVGEGSEEVPPPPPVRR